MSTTINRLFVPLLGLGLLASSGCASFKLKDPPPGFIEVSSSHYDNDSELRMKAPDNVGLNITSFSNHRGGNLSLWAEDLVKKLAARGYTLTRQSPVKSGNKVEGTRFDFSYEPPGSDAGEKFYTTVLFVTDDWRVVVQLAGQAELQTAHAGDLDKILGEIKIRGCKTGSKVCNSGQPRQFDAAQMPKPNTGPDQDEGDGEGEDKKPKDGGGDEPAGTEGEGAGEGADADKKPDDADKPKKADGGGSSLP